MPALAAVMPARPPTPIKTAFNLLPDVAPAKNDLIASGAACWLFLLRSLILLPQRVARDAFLIALMSSSLVMFVRLSIPMLAARSTSSCLL
jgi:hypothetical protein